MLQEINTMLDVVTFLEDIAKEINNYNPFTDFATYTYPETGILMYSKEQAALRNRLLDRCFEVCAAQSDNFIYLSIVLFERGKG